MFYITYVLIALHYTRLSCIINEVCWVVEESAHLLRACECVMVLIWASGVLHSRVRLVWCLLRWSASLRAEQEILQLYVLLVVSIVSCLGNASQPIFFGYLLNYFCLQLLHSL